MHTAFTHMRNHNQVFSTLYPFKEAYYEPFGYITFPQFRVAICSPHALTPLFKIDIPGSVQRLSLTDGFAVFIAFLQKTQTITHGMGILPLSELERLKNESPFWLAVATEKGTPVGILTYKITGYQKDLRVRDFFYTTSSGKYLLLQWLGKHADQIKQILFPIKPDEEPDLWVTDAFWGDSGQIRTREWAPNPMGRVVIVEGLSGLKVGKGKVSLKISDTECPWNNRSFSFEEKNGILQVMPTEEAEDQLSISGLSALVYGCYDPNDFPYKHWGTPAKDTQSTLYSLFPPRKPFLHADF